MKKRTLFFLFAFIFVSFISCNREETNNTPGVDVDITDEVEYYCVINGWKQITLSIEDGSDAEWIDEDSFFHIKWDAWANCINMKFYRLFPTFEALLKVNSPAGVSDATLSLHGFNRHYGICASFDGDTCLGFSKFYLKRTGPYTAKVFYLKCDYSG